ncbi:MAG TPA: hypothetical protein PLN05_04905 [Pyrinomonadaceae bacterium]|nr:hypothetical protein [Chloracidobacterium sp.]HBE83577.1 hypothetical protein [Blastocatellia bacterium]HRJ88005.1 hypothetical protein [Pyrinomonadaceae bacterium]HRK49750.1 hypothetical protein [Pyrinomonadaceae bacterium]
MKRNLSLVFWLAMFVGIVGIEVISAFGQNAALVGTWTNGSVGSIQYKDRVTGSTSPGRGSHFSYKFFANGSYEFVGYMESTMYSCRSTLFNQITGKYRVDGSTIDLDPARDFWKSTNSCAASGNKQTAKTPVRKTVEFRQTMDDYGATLLCLNDGTGETCYRREK